MSDRWPLWAALGALIVALVVLVEPTARHWFCVQSGTCAPGDVHYNWWSGAGSDLGEVALIGTVLAAFSKMNCGVRGCWRLSRHEYDMDGVKHALCRKHHPGITNDRAVTHASILEHHRNHQPKEKVK